MELVFLCLSLLVHQSVTQESCKCLDPSLCGDPAGCGYRCRAGFAGKFCSHANLGYKLSAEAPAIFDGDFSTCREYRGRITFSHPIDIDKIRVHRKNKRTGHFYAYIYKGSTSVVIWELPQYKKFTEGEAAAVSFPLQTGVTAIRINNLGTASEVELTAECPRQRYGRDCNQTCYTNCKDGECDPADGFCLCKPGWTGSNCETECATGRYGAQCKSLCGSNCNSCHHVSGSCEHNCQPGWVAENCDHECPRGSYGLNCSSSCSSGCEYEVCEPKEGACYSETCTAGWKHLNENHTRCDEKCASGSYGSGCSLSCSEGCEDGSCHHVSGNCSCREGWTRRTCTEKCGSGSYGSDCSLSCSEGCEDGSCHHVSGNCSCREGWTGRTCTEMCSPGCVDVCDPEDGSCATCKPGWTHKNTNFPSCNSKCENGFYGQDCGGECSVRCEDTCDHVTGACTCSPGWTGTHCSHVCQDGYYGSGCVQRCSQGCKYGECNHVDGSCVCKPGTAGEWCMTKTCSPGCADVCDPSDMRCERCKPGWTHSHTSNPLCDKALDMKENKGSEKTNSGYIIAGVLFAVIAVLVAIIAVGIFKYRTLRNRLTKADQGPIHSEIDGKNEYVAISDIKAATDNECYENIETVSKKEEESDHYVDPAQV